MFKNYFKTAWRNIVRRKFYSLVNVLGLSVGIAFTFLVAAYVWSEVKVNQSLLHPEQIYLLENQWKGGSEGATFKTIAPLAVALKQQYPNLVSNYYRWDWVSTIVSKGDKHFRDSLQIGDTTLVSIFGFPLLYGNKHNLFSQRDAVVITESKAMKYFGKTDVVGETLTIENYAGEHKDFIVSGVLKDLPENSVSLSIVPINTTANATFVSINNISFFYKEANIESWGSTQFTGYVALQKGVTTARLQQAIQQLLKANAPDDITKNLTVHPACLATYHLDENNGVVRKMLWALSFIALFILLMAVVNFINITIGSSSSRLKEIGGAESAGFIGAEYRCAFIERLTETLAGSHLYRVAAWVLCDASMAAKFCISNFIKCVDIPVGCTDNVWDRLPDGERQSGESSAHESGEKPADGIKTCIVNRGKKCISQVLDLYINTNMKQYILFILLFLPAVYSNAQKLKAKKDVTGAEIKVSMQPAYWDYDTATTEFITYKNTSVIKGKNGGGFQVFLKNQIFESGTIEFDVELSGMGFPGINFRMSDDRKNGENFYIRSFGPVLPETRTTLQYAALMDGMSIWDLTDEYQAGAIIYQNKWNHVKLVVSGKQMKAYVNDMNKPALIVPELESWRNSGGISLSGNVIYANLVIKPNVTEGLSSETGYISTYNDTRYLRNWMVSPAKDFPFGKDIIIPLPSMYGKLNESDLPDSTTQWTPVKAEPRGIVNLSRIYGLKENDVRRIAWLKATIQSDRAQEKTLNLGFSDEVWVFINGQVLYVDKNYFGTPQQKSQGRCTIENTSLKLPLTEGKNEMLIAVANYFYGWGIIARLNNTDGIQLEK